ncbi:MAG: hypothetical protein IJ060_11455 [Oscillospiraceae bacterium]|nr:hypothetical protein [Oscillospiraceae bacterium]
MSEDKFTFRYAPARISEADRIAEKYRGTDTAPDSDLERLKRLDRQAERPGTFAGIAVGLIGVLILGTGLSLVLSFHHLIAGLLVGVIGLVIAGIATPVSKAVTKRSRLRYRDEILALHEKIKNG